MAASFILPPWMSNSGLLGTNLPALISSNSSSIINGSVNCVANGSLYSFDVCPVSRLLLLGPSFCSYSILPRLFLPLVLVLSLKQSSSRFRRKRQHANSSRTITKTKKNARIEIATICHSSNSAILRVDL